MSGPCVSFMREGGSVLSEGRQDWLSWCVVRLQHPTETARAKLETFRTGFKPAVSGLNPDFVSTHWREISSKDGRILCADRAKNGLAYNPNLYKQSARARYPKSDAFFDLFDEGACCFVNWGELSNDGRSGSWSPMTCSTFDLAVGVVDADKVGIFCIEDED